MITYLVNDFKLFGSLHIVKRIFLYLLYDSCINFSMFFVLYFFVNINNSRDDDQNILIPNALLLFLVYCLHFP